MALDPEIFAKSAFDLHIDKSNQVWTIAGLRMTFRFPFRFIFRLQQRT